MIKKLNLLISDSDQLLGQSAITDGLIYFRHSRTNPTEKGAEQERTVQWSCKSAREGMNMLEKWA